MTSNEGPPSPPYVGRHIVVEDRGPHCLRCGRPPVREECEPGSLSDKLWLDDMRAVPIGYNLHARTVDEAIALLQRRVVWHASLDHDLDPAHYAHQTNPGGYNAPSAVWDRAGLAVKTGYAVLEWMAANGTWIPDIQVHSLSTGAEDMMAFLRKNAPDWVNFRRVKPKET